jgi:hypothetical protein
MSFSEMSSREKTIIVILGVVILVALAGIGILVARLVTGNGQAGDAPPITVAATPIAGATTPGAGVSEGTITPVATPSLKDLAQTTPQPVAASPVVVVRTESPGSPLPVLLTSFPLHAGRVYRLEVTAVDGSSFPIQGSWSQAAMGADGEVSAALPELFEATTPYSVDVVSPLAKPSTWSLSASAAPANLLAPTANLVITVYDVTGTE